MSKQGKQPKVGDQVKLFADYGNHDVNATVRDLLSEQFTATYEVQRPDGGWVERTSFRFYRDHGETWR